MRLRNRERVSSAAGGWLPRGFAPTPVVTVANASSDVVRSIGGDLFRIVTWTASGSITPASAIDVEYLVVAGGGGGGNGAGNNGGGGGGAGGLLTNVGGSALSLSASAHTITVGAGGAGSTNGNNSLLGALVTSTGGGAGGSPANTAGSAGGSGGGASRSSTVANVAGGLGTVGQGNNGGIGTANIAGGAGGGGAGQVGASSAVGQAGKGGDGAPNSITGTATTYAGGGGGATSDGPVANGAGGIGGGGAGVRLTAGIAGTNGLGAGGGGSSGASGGAGGNGVVVVRWKLSSQATVVGASSDVLTTIGGDLFRVVTWTSSGSITPTSSLDVEYLVVAGGGGGLRGGGGAGGLVTNVGGATLSVPRPTTVTIGAGGVGFAPANTRGNNGSASSFGSVSTVGGGGGANGNNVPGNGGSGGGAGNSTFATTYAGGTATAGQGNAGGSTTRISAFQGGGAGGGGAGAVGASVVDSLVGGDGGVGAANTITGSSVTYAGGGGGFGGGAGGAGGGGGVGVAGTNGLGGGGGGGDTGSVRSGGSGVVIVRWKLADPFTPLRLSPALWLDAADTSRITASSGSVSQWNDKSPNGFEFRQSLAANQPTTGTRTVNSLNAIDFDGSTDLLSTASAVQLVSAVDGTYTAFAVALADTTANSPGGIITADSSPRQPQMLRRHFGAMQSVRVIPTVVTAQSATSPLGTTNPFIALVTMSASSLDVRVNGGSSSPAALTGTLDTSSSVASVGVTTTSGGASGWFDGVICEVVVFGRVLTATEMNLMGNYLNAKWNASWSNI